MHYRNNLERKIIKQSTTTTLQVPEIIMRADAIHTLISISTFFLRSITFRHITFYIS